MRKAALITPTTTAAKPAALMLQVVTATIAKSMPAKLTEQNSKSVTCKYPANLQGIYL